MSAGTVLYVEDDDLIARSVLRMTDLPYTLVRVASATEAQAWLLDPKRSAVAVVVDRRLPDGDGMRLAEWARERGVPSGVVSGGPRPAGSDLPWMMKPFTRVEMIDFLTVL